MMAHSGIAPARLSALAELLESRTGLYFPPTRRDGLERALVRMAEAEGGVSADALARRLLEREWDAACLSALARELTVGETGFFRHPEHWAMLAEVILPERIAAAETEGRPVRVWSAACSSGEEPYSAAILLDRFGGEEAVRRFEITGTDINPEALAKARAAEYSAWSFRDAPPDLATRYFEPVGGTRFRLAERIRRRVTFARFNLFEAASESVRGTCAVDVIFCRNVLIYFSPAKAAELLRRLHAALNPGGWLLVSPAETAFVDGALFERRRIGSGHCFRRADAAAPVWTAPVAASPVFAVIPEAGPVVEPEPQVSPAPVAARADAAVAPGSHEMLERVHALFGKADYAGVLALPEPDVARATTAEGLALVRYRVRALANIGRTDEALDLTERALAVCRTDAALHYLHAVLLESQRRVEPALTAVRRALFLDGELVMGHVLSGHLLASQGRPEVAAKCYAQAMRLLESRDASCPVPESDAMTCETLRAALAMLLESTGGRAAATPMRNTHA